MSRRQRSEAGAVRLAMPTSRSRALPWRCLVYHFAAEAPEIVDPPAIDQRPEAVCRALGGRPISVSFSYRGEQRPLAEPAPRSRNV